MESKSEKRGAWSGQYNFKICGAHNVSPSTVYLEWFNPTADISPTPQYKLPNFPFARLKKFAKHTQELILRSSASSSSSHFPLYRSSIPLFSRGTFTFLCVFNGSVCWFIPVCCFSCAIVFYCPPFSVLFVLCSDNLFFVNCLSSDG